MTEDTYKINQTIFNSLSLLGITIDEFCFQADICLSFPSDRKWRAEDAIFISNELKIPIDYLIQGKRPVEYELLILNSVIEKEFNYKVSKELKKKLKKLKKQRWESEKQMYGARLRFNIRVKRLFPKLDFRVPALDEFISHKLLRIFSLASCLKMRLSYIFKFKDLKDFYYMDRRYGQEILVTGSEFHLFREIAVSLTPTSNKKETLKKRIVRL